MKKSENNPKKNLLWDEAEDFVQNGKVYQLYTLYRDKDGNIKQVTDDQTSNQSAARDLNNCLGSITGAKTEHVELC